MVARNLVRAAVFTLIALAFAASAPAKPPPGTSGPNGPTNLRITASTDTSISLAWDASRGGSTSFWYCVQVDGAGCYRVDPPTTSFTRSSLWPGRTTTWTVVAVDMNGKRSAPSNAVTFTTPPDTTAPSPPPELSVTAVYPTRVFLAWTQSKDNTQVYYTLFKDGEPIPEGSLGFGSATVLDLSPATTYEFVVAARDYFGNSVRGNVVSVTTPPVTDTTPPTAPTNLRLSPESSIPEIWLDWDPSTDETNSQAEIMYDVYLNGVPEHGSLGGTDTIVYCKENGLTVIAIRAVDASGNVSEPSNEIVFDCG